MVMSKKYNSEKFLNLSLFTGIFSALFLMVRAEISFVISIFSIFIGYYAIELKFEERTSRNSWHYLIPVSLSLIVMIIALILIFRPDFFMNYFNIIFNRG